MSEIVSTFFLRNNIFLYLIDGAEVVQIKLFCLISKLVEISNSKTETIEFTKFHLTEYGIFTYSNVSFLYFD